MTRLLATLLAAALLAAGAACGGGGGGDGAGTNGGGNGSGNGSTPLELVGVITELEGTGDDIKGFTLRTDEGETHVITLDPAIDYGFPDSLLEEHRDNAQRLRVGVERRDNRVYATVILNA